MNRAAAVSEGNEAHTTTTTQCRRRSRRSHARLLHGFTTRLGRHDCDANTTEPTRAETRLVGRAALLFERAASWRLSLDAVRAQEDRVGQPRPLCVPRGHQEASNMPVTRARRKRSSRRRQAIPGAEKRGRYKGSPRDSPFQEKRPRRASATRSLFPTAPAPTRERSRERTAPSCAAMMTAPPLPQRPRGGAHPSPSHAAPSSLSQAADELTQRRSDCLTPAQRNQHYHPPSAARARTGSFAPPDLDPRGEKQRSPPPPLQGQDLSPADDGSACRGSRRNEKNQPRADASRWSATSKSNMSVDIPLIGGYRVNQHAEHRSGGHPKGVLLDIDLPGSETETHSLIETPINILRATLRGSSMFVHI
ncbi:hypothetical protein HPB48_026942 [Haemaphysalis longicornis]|uniref:Uncharacterized protein n=1 Tax=Haemaphysalis longicornis TaxID=44386 RepID=A0A9J6HDF8_HAELO|nr:hypothetical protein HPB48_026942 [Haemaphysalis longicornis]